jgi:DNA-binding transcriptional ArsR family regulator
VVVDELDADRVFAALADATRRDIVMQVLQQDESISALAAHYDMSWAAVQKHVAVLERAHLVSKHRHGRHQIVRGNVETIRAASRVLGQYEELWRGRVDRMHRLLAEEARQEPQGKETG